MLYLLLLNIWKWARTPFLTVTIFQNYTNKIHYFISESTNLLEVLRKHLSASTNYLMTSNVSLSKSSVESLCSLAMNKIQSSKYNSETFTNVIIEAGKGRLIDGSRFRNWIIAYVKQHYEALSESILLKTTIVEGRTGTMDHVLSIVVMRGAPRN